ncbi:MAG: hypothetical protein Q4P14_00910 [Methanobacteriaceae archaeon]|nr:hypothetical protein [Methanobacteriaceae archaeon]
MLLGLLFVLILSVSAVNAVDINVIDVNENNLVDNLSSTPSLEKYEVTVDNYDDYFNSEGLNSIINDGDTLVLKGDFINKGQIILNKKVNLIGDNAKITNTTIYVNANGCHIENLSIINEYAQNSNCWGIKIFEANNISIIGCNISVRDKNTSYGIYLFDSKNNVIRNNNIKTRGDRLTYSVVGYEVYNTNIAFNNLTSIGTGELHGYEGIVNIDGEHSLVEGFRTYAVLMAYSSNNTIYKNYVDVSSDINKSVSAYSESENTIVGIDFYFDCHNNVIDSNTVRMTANDPFIYGLGSLGSGTNGGVFTATNNSFINNDILLNGSYMVSGIILGAGSIGSIVKNNNIILYAQNYTYGLTLELSDNATIISNTIKEYGINNYGMEFFSSDYNIVKNNYVYGGGEFAENLGLYDSNYNTIKNNTLISNGSYIPPHYEALSSHTDVVLLGSSEVSIASWINSLDKDEYNTLVNHINSGFSKNEYVRDVSLSKFDEWLDSTGEDKQFIIDWINDPFSVLVADGPSPSEQNGVHADMVELWNTPLWLDKSNNNDISDNAFGGRNPFQGMSSGSALNNTFKNNKYSNKFNSNSNILDEEDGDIDLDKINSLLNGSSKLSSSSNNNAEGSSSVGDLPSTDSGSAKAYELNSATKSMTSPYAIPLIVLFLVALFCFGFLRNDEENDGS